MAIESIPVWRFQPNWSSDVVETLEWLTDIMSSPLGIEQRRSLRYFPRRFLEFTALVAGRERTLADNLIATYGGGAWYLPTWHEPYLLSAPFLPIGTSAITLVSTDGLASGQIGLLFGGDVFQYELVEISAVVDNVVTISAPTTKLWRADAMLFVVKRAKLTEQPDFERRSDAVARLPVKFRIDAADSDDGVFIPQLATPWLAPTYQGYSVLNIAPNDTQPLTSSFARLMEELDTKTSTPFIVDTAGRPFGVQQYEWYLRGRADHSGFAAMLQALRGRAAPLWLPSFSSDLSLAEPINSGDTVVTVELAGFTEAGGARPGRRHIRILLNDGTSIYNAVLASASGSNSEAMSLVMPIGRDIQPHEVSQISFMTFARLDQDRVEINHHTDVDGVSAVAVVFRELPDRYQILTDKAPTFALTNRKGTFNLLGRELD